MRFLPHTSDDIAQMLKITGLSSLEELFSTIPAECRAKQGLNLPAAMSEWQLNRHMDSLAKEMAAAPDFKVFMGAGRYQHHIPYTLNYLLGRSEFTTAYTPYQPEMNQGTLQAIYEFQTLCCRLLGMDIATASHYDGATALAEAILIALRKSKSKKIALAKTVNPLFRQVIDTYLAPVECEIIDLPWALDGATEIAALPDKDLAAVVIQSPNFFGVIEDLVSFADLAHESEALLIVTFTEPLAYGLLKPPGSQGADLVAGEGQSLGVPISYGGPGLGILASSCQFLRNLPGRLVGETTDLDGERGFVLTLATREQHIRREKATSNICSNNGLCAVMAAMYLASLGGSGLKTLAGLNRDKTEYLKQQLIAQGHKITFSGPTFNEFVVDFGHDFEAKYERLLSKKMVAGLPLKKFYPELAGHYLLCATEVMEKNDMDNLVKEISR